MFELLKRALPYGLLALMFVWSLSLQRGISALESDNASLRASMTEMARVAENNERAVVEWVEAHDAATRRVERLNAEFGKVDDHRWGDDSLPDEYVRVLVEAGMLDGVRSAGPSGDTVQGSGDTEAYRNDKQGSAAVCPRR